MTDDRSTSDSAVAAEADRIRREYERREREIEPGLYDPARPANLWRLQERMRWSIALLRRADLLPLASRRLLEIGCGDAHWLAEMGTQGASIENMAGIDLFGQRIAKARRRFGGEREDPSRAAPDFRIGDATRLPWPDQSFDIVLQSTVFSSILDQHVQALVAREMIRVLAPGGVVLWYDLRVNNPRNPNVRGISVRDLRRLFPNCVIRSRMISLAPPIARWLVPRSWLAAALLEAARVLNTFHIATIRPS
jgi:ubiquinone/menaquinone biosynthesis C-methylase UbiE